MDILLTIIADALLIAVAVLITALICFLKIFYLRKEKVNPQEYSIPEGKIYEPFRESMIHWQKKARELPRKEVSITSFDGLLLRGTYYEYSPEAPIEILFHGYKGSAERDLSGGVFRCFALGHSALLVDQRAGRQSGGRVTTFGINESRDCASWVDFVIENINKDAKIIIGGVSMGASTVMIASAMDLPKNVVGILADCGYTSAKAIIKKVMREMKLPPNLLYPFVRLGARLFGKFDIDETSPLEAMGNCRLPIIFFHGESDDFVPCQMSIDNYNACVSPKKLVLIPGAGHGLCYPIEPETYVEALKSFFEPITEEKQL